MNTRTRSRQVLPLATLAALGLLGLDSAFAGRVEDGALKSGESFSRFIVKFDGRSEAGRSASNARTAVDRLSSAVGQALSHNRRLAVGADLIQLEGKGLSGEAARQLMARIAADPSVVYVEPDARMTIQLTPNDTRYAEQWHYFDSVAGLNVPSAWDQTTGSGVVVAVIDTGITAHTDLSANLVAGYDFISDATAARDGNGRDNNPQDQGDWWTNAECGPAPVPPSQNSSWHGTHVAGTIGAVSNNAKGVAGVAYGAKVQPIRVLGKCGGSLSDIADAIIWASGGTVSGIPANATPAKVINMSLGGGGSCGTTYQSAIDGAVGRGSVVVVAAGNSNADASGFRPASCNNVITVAASDKEGNRASYSNYGTTIDVTAPGGETATTAKGVLSTLNSGTTTPSTESYAFYQGTSMASPHVAGVAALMKAKNSALTPAQIESTLKANTRALAGTCSGGCGAGLVDANKAVTAAGGGTPPPTGGTLSNGVAVTIAAATGGAVNYTMAVPAGATGLSFATSGGTGDGDLYVKFGSAPTTSSYDCRPYLSGNNETCNIATAQAGTYYVMVRAYSAFSGVSLRGSYTAGGTTPSFFENQTDFTISDNVTVESPITVSGRSGNAPSTLRVGVTIYHTYQGDLKVDLVAPDGSIYTLHNRTGTSTDNIITTYTVNASTELANGTWKLRVNDNGAGDVGRIDKWSLQF